MSSDDTLPFLEIPEIVSVIIRAIDPEKLGDLEFNQLLSAILNFGLRPKKTKIDEFTLSRAEMPIPSYSPGVFPEKFVPVKSIREIVGISPQILWADFVITREEHSRIKAKGVGELSIYRKNGELKVEVRDLWFIEEVKEIEPDKDRQSRVKALQEFIKDVVVVFLANLLTELIARLTKGS